MGFLWPYLHACSFNNLPKLFIFEVISFILECCLVLLAASFRFQLLDFILINLQHVFNFSNKIHYNVILIWKKTYFGMHQSHGVRNIETLSPIQVHVPCKLFMRYLSVLFNIHYIAAHVKCMYSKYYRYVNMNAQCTHMHIIYIHRHMKRKRKRKKTRKRVSKMFHVVWA